MPQNALDAAGVNDPFSRALDDFLQFAQAEMQSPEDAFAYGEGIPKDASAANLLPAVELGLSLAPGSGEAMAARDAWAASGRGANALERGAYGTAAGEYINALSAAAGAIPGAGIIARGTKRGAAWMDRNLPAGVNKLLDGIMPSDPRNTTNIFAGPTAKTADHAALAKAQDMAASGANRDDILRDTGWFKGVDGKWQFEIDDSGAKTVPGGMLGEFQTLRYLDHPELENAYDLGRVEFEGTVAPHFDTRGSWIPSANRVTVKGPNLNDAHETALHEYQHVVDDIEGFAPGGTTEGFSPQEVAAEQRRLMAMTPSEEQVRGMLYHRLAGETKARNVPYRKDMTAADRRAKGPWKTQDVPDDQQIVRFR